jgi:putative ABC transport system permease protein
MTLNFRLAWRNLVRAKTYSATAIGSLTLGIAGVVAMFAIVEAVLLRQLPYKEPERVVLVQGSALGRRDNQHAYLLSPPHLDRWREGTRTIESLTIFRPGGANVTGIQTVQQVNILRVSADFFSTLGYQPQLGRWLTREEEQDLEIRRAVIADGLWRDAYGADPEIVGKPIYLDGIAHEVVGVAPATVWLPRGEAFYTLPGPISVFLPLQAPAGERVAPSFLYYGFARLVKGATAEQAAAELTANMPPVTWKANFPPPDEIVVTPLHAKLVENSRVVLLLLLGAVTSLLLLVCVNVGNLTLVRWERDRKELAIRLALGASWRQLAGLCLAESSLLATVGTVAGCLLGAWLVSLVQAHAAVSVPRLELAGVNGMVLLFTVAMGSAVALVIGLLPAARVARQSSHWEIGLASRGSTGGREVQRLQRVLVRVQAALAVVLVSGAVLFLVSLGKVLEVPEGYDADRVVTAKLTPPRHRYPQQSDRLLLAERLTEQVRRIPGVVSAAASTVMPNEPSWALLNVESELRSGSDKHWGASAYYVYATKDYFPTLGIPLLEGRIPEDRAPGERPVVISQSLVKDLFSGVSPIGRVLRNGVNGWAETVVGVVGNVYPDGLDRPPANIVYRNFQMTTFGGGTPVMILLVRTGLSGEAVASDLRKAVAAVDPELAVPSVRTLRQIPRAEVSIRQLQALLTSGFGFLALVLSAAGVYGIVEFSLSRRRKELAIRMALGADGRRIRRIVWREALVPVILGVVPGVAGAAGLGMLVRGLFFGVSPTEPAVLFLSPLLLVAAAMVPAYVLGKRTERIAPAVVMQAE